MLKLTKVIFILCILLDCTAMAHADEAVFATVREVTGNVTLSDGSPVTVGQSVKPGQVLETHTGTQAVLSMDEEGKNFLRIEEETSLGFESKSKASLGYGSVYVELNGLPAGSTFQLRTPTAVATVRGTSFRMVYRQDSSRTLVIGLSGQVEIAAAKSGAPFGSASTLNAGESVSIGIDGVIKKKAASSGSNAVKVLSAKKAYYITNDCKVENSITECEQSAEPANKQAGEAFVDFLMYINDEVLLPVRASMPYDDSRLSLALDGVLYQFEGIMILCMDVTASGTVRVKLFQAGKHKVEVAKSNDGDMVTVRSGNQLGLKGSQIGVREGRVAVTAPWLCESCDATKTFLVEEGECFHFHDRPQVTGNETPKPVNFDPPKHADAVN